jgi:hypothetical protein
MPVRRGLRTIVTTGLTGDDGDDDVPTGTVIHADHGVTGGAAGSPGDAGSESDGGPDLGSR